MSADHPNGQAANRQTGLLRRLPLIGRAVARHRRPIVAVVRLEGVIARGSGALSLRNVEKALERAFRQPRARAVALIINSPGGSPAQSALIAGRVRDLAAEFKRPVLAFCEDAAASGGYWLACAADEVFAQPASIVGSIGVLHSGFGFPEMLKKLGVERRVHTAGANKARLDPFRPEEEADVRHLKKLQSAIHRQFRDWVRDRRGDRLKGAERTLFSGDFWTGEDAVDLGLVDATGDMRAVCRDRFGEKVRFREFTPAHARWRRRMGLSGASAGLASGVAAAVEERARWGRLGL